MHTFDYKFMYIRFHIEACIRTVFIYNNVQKINMNFLLTFVIHRNHSKYRLKFCFIYIIKCALRPPVTFPLIMICKK